MEGCVSKTHKKIRPNIPLADRITCPVKEASEVSGIGLTKLYELINDGTLETTKVGTMRLVLVRSLIKLLDPSDKKAA
jgi:excisionase family DNA binding protein